MDGMSGRCLGCQADLRPDARFCPRCGQRAVGLTQDAAHPPTITALASHPVEPEPAAATHGDWDDWYTITPPRPKPPPNRPDAFPPPAPPGGQLAPGSVPPQRRPGQLQPYQRQAPGGQPGYQPWGPARPPAPPYGPPRGSRRPQSNAGLWTILLLLLAVGGALLVLLLARPFGSHGQRQTANSPSAVASRTAPAARKSHAPGSATAAPSSTAGTGSSPPGSSAAERRAASSVASMLSRSAAERSAIIGAATGIGNCGPGLATAPQVFDDAAASRRSMLAGLAAMPGRDTLPPALVGDLTQAWQASIAADQAYAQWANDEITRGCVRDDTSDPGYQATVAPDRLASQYKDSFVVLWNPIASGYGLTQYSADQF